MLWKCRITPRVPTNESPFKLAFKIEVMISIEIRLSTMRIEYYEEPSNLDQLRANLDLLEETWNQAHLRMVVYRQ